MGLQVANHFECMGMGCMEEEKDMWTTSFQADDPRHKYNHIGKLLKQLMSSS
jgi:hypothetical protein